MPGATPTSRDAQARFDELKRYVRFGAEEAALLAAFGPRARPHVPRVVTEFYDRIREHEAAHAVFADEDQIARLQVSLGRWLDRLFDGTYDAAFFEQTERIGRVHVKVGLPQRYMFTAMALIRSSLEVVVDEEAGIDAPRVRDALSRLLDLQLAVMLESYRDDYVQRIARSFEREREEASRQVRRYVDVVELAPCLVVGLDASGNVELFNAEAERASGWARDELAGQAFIDVLVLPRDREAFVAASAGAAAAAARVPVEATLPTRAGKSRRVRWDVVHVPEAARAGVTTLLVGSDVTEERETRERQDQQERLAAIGTLAAGLAHEIRNPLNGARLHVALLARSLANDPARADEREAVAVVDYEIKRLATLVSDFLDFARPRPPQLVASSARAIAERSAQVARAEAEAQGVSLSVDLPAKDLELVVDSERLEQVLLNLLLNAIDAAVGGGRRVTLRLRREPRRGFFEVEDDGPGIPDLTAPLFDAFYTTKSHGTGLGLAIVHRIVTDHGGTIDVDSRPGRTRFRVTLPLAAPLGVPSESTV